MKGLIVVVTALVLSACVTEPTRKKIPKTKQLEFLREYAYVVCVAEAYRLLPKRNRSVLSLLENDAAEFLRLSEARPSLSLSVTHASIQKAQGLSAADVILECSRWKKSTELSSLISDLAD